VEVFNEIVIPVAAKFQPEWILVSAGFDPHRDDPLGGMAVTEKGFGLMASSLLQLAETFAGGKIAFLLEGGYHLGALKSSVATVLQQMKGSNGEGSVPETGAEEIRPLIRKILEFQARYW
jgi:acetoin utilization deacetylase AcuC-like enzyme